jgi:hypothetical protein
MRRLLCTVVPHHLLIVGLVVLLVVPACSPDDAKERRRSGGRRPVPPAENGDDDSERPPRSRLDTQKPLNLDGGNVLAAPVKYLHATLRARNRVEDKIYVAEATNAVRTFDVMEGRKPKSLEELEKWLKDEGSALHAPSRGGKYHYDPKTGEIFIYDPEDE